MSTAHQLSPLDPIWASASVSHCDADENDGRTLREKWIDGEVTCACPASRIDGVLVRDAASCVCSRMAMVETAHGPRLIPGPPCTPEGDELHADATTEPDVDLERRSVKIIAATTTGGVGVGVKRWDTARFLKNPILCDSHDQDRTIGHVEDLVVHADGQITGTAVLARADVNPRAEAIWLGIVRGHLRGISPFVVKRSDGSAELVECSVVPVPKDGATVIRRRPLAKSPTTSSEETRIMNTLPTTHTDAMEIRLDLARATQQATARTASRTLPASLRGTLGKVDVANRSVAILAATVDDVGDGTGAITSWDLSRFSSNPCVLWAHDDRALPIGIAENVETTPEGLCMRVRFATKDANPLGEQVWQGVQQGIVRAVSVSFDPLGDGRATLLEVSFVPIGMDPGAGTADLVNASAEPDEGTQQQARASAAARELATHRHRKPDDAGHGETRSFLGEATEEEIREASTPFRKSALKGGPAPRHDATELDVDAARARARRAQADAWKGVTAQPAPAVERIDGLEDLADPIGEARRRRDASTRDMWKTPTAKR